MVEAGLTDPAPFSVILTLVALPPNVLPLTVTDDKPQVLPELLLRDTVGGSAHPQVTSKLLPVIVHPNEFITVMLWVPFATPVKLVSGWNEPPSRLYINPAPVGLKTVTFALPKPREQSTVWLGLSGNGG
jgi:hypothetical protein